MKYVPHFLVAAASVLSFVSFAAPSRGGSVPTTTQIGPHSEQTFALARRAGAKTLDPKAVMVMALVLTVEQKMNGNQQEIVAKASAHQDGPHGPLASAQGVQVRIIDPSPPLASTPRKTAEAGEVNVSKTIPATGGKYKTVTAEATMENPQFANAHVTLTIPGGP